MRRTSVRVEVGTRTADKASNLQMNGRVAVADRTKVAFEISDVGNIESYL